MPEIVLDVSGVVKLAEALSAEVSRLWPLLRQRDRQYIAQTLRTVSNRLDHCRKHVVNMTEARFLGQSRAKAAAKGRVVVPPATDSGGL
jgi:hypothetical protein